MKNEVFERMRRLTEACATAIGDVRRTGSTDIVHPDTEEPLVVQVDEIVGRALVRTKAGAVLYQVRFKPTRI